MATATILVHPSGTPAGFGIGQDGETIEIITPCCMGTLKYDSISKLDMKSLSGVSKGPAVVRCTSCNTPYRGYSDVTCAPRSGRSSWLELWTGLKDVEVSVTQTEFDF